MVLSIITFCIMSSTKDYTLTLLTPSDGSPSFLRTLQQSDAYPLWLGQGPRFYSKYKPSTWPWSHIILTEGKSLSLPMRCKTMQTWKYQIEADEPFLPDHDSMIDDGSRNCSNLPADRYTPCDRTRRFCALYFLASEDREAEQAHRQNLSSIAEEDKELGMRVQLTGRITDITENLGVHAKGYVKKKGKGKNRIHRSWEEYEDALTSNVTRVEPVAAAEPREPTPTFFVMLSFSSEKEHEQYLSKNKDKMAEESFILAKHLYLPPKNKPISSNDWSYGNPHEPVGQDWFG